MANVFDSTF